MDALTETCGSSLLDQLHARLNQSGTNEPIATNYSIRRSRSTDQSSTTNQSTDHNHSHNNNNNNSSSSNNNVHRMSTGVTSIAPHVSHTNDYNHHIVVNSTAHVEPTIPPRRSANVRRSSFMEHSSRFDQSLASLIRGAVVGAQQQQQSQCDVDLSSRIDRVESTFLDLKDKLDMGAPFEARLHELLQQQQQIIMSQKKLNAWHARISQEMKRANVNILNQIELQMEMLQKSVEDIRSDCVPMDMGRKSMQSIGMPVRMSVSNMTRLNEFESSGSLASSSEESANAFKRWYDSMMSSSPRASVNQNQNHSQNQLQSQSEQCQRNEAHRAQGQRLGGISLIHSSSGPHSTNRIRRIGQAPASSRVLAQVTSDMQQKRTASRLHSTTNTMDNIVIRDKVGNNKDRNSRDKSSNWLTQSTADCVNNRQASTRDDTLGGGPVAGGEQSEFFCNELGCGKSFPTLRKLRHHHVVHSDEYPFICDIDGCSKRFKRKFGIDLHSTTHFELVPSMYSKTSNSCSLPFFGRRMQYSMCKPCGKKFKTVQEYQYHMMRHGEEPFKCPVKGCGQKFSIWKSFQKHRASHYFNYHCRMDDKCKHQTTNLQLLKLHIYCCHFRRSLPADVPRVLASGSGSASGTASASMSASPDVDADLSLDDGVDEGDSDAVSDTLQEDDAQIEELSPKRIKMTMEQDHDEEESHEKNQAIIEHDENGHDEKLHENESCNKSDDVQDYTNTSHHQHQQQEPTNYVESGNSEPELKPDVSDLRTSRTRNSDRLSRLNKLINLSAQCNDNDASLSSSQLDQQACNILDSSPLDRACVRRDGRLRRNPTRSSSVVGNNYASISRGNLAAPSPSHH